MTKRVEILAAIMALALAAAMPLGGALARPNNKPTAHNAPARHASAPHVAVHRSAPHFTAHRAAPHFAAHRTATRHSSPHVTAHRSVAVHRANNAIDHTVHVATPAVTHRRHATTHRFSQQQAHHNAPAHSNAAAQSNALAQPNALARTHNAHHRHHNYARVTPQAARAGRFASRYADPRTHRHDHFAARRAWRHHQRAGFVSWYGPVFWPYAYSDIFDYAFWPDGYDDGYWDYAYDDFIDGLFWGENGPPDEYADAGPDAEPASSVRSAAVAELCQQPGSGITAWPFAEIESKVNLNGDQKHLLGAVRDAAQQAASVFKASCPAAAAFPLTPPGRLRAMTARLDATLEAVQTVRPPLTAFYNALNDEQKERFNELGPAGQKNNAVANRAMPPNAKACAEAKPGLTNLPIQQIADAVKPTDAQQDALDSLNDATTKAVSILQGACPQETPLTPPGRLGAMQTRLKAMIDAANTVKPAIDAFYGQLSNEQKARFDRIGQELAQVGG